MAISDDILDETLRHAHYLERHKASVVRRIVELLNNSNDEYYAAMYKGRIENMNRRDLDKLLVRLKRSIKAGYEPVIELLDGEIRDLGRAESAWQQKTLNGLVPIEIDWEAPSEEQIYAAAHARPFEGLLLRDWYNGLADGHFKRIKQAIRQGYVEGQTTDEIVRGIQEVGANRSRRAAETAVRTALTHTSNVARQESYRRNRRVVKRIEWVATLDKRTTAVCRARDGKTWPVDEGPRPPAHAGCRSTTIPVLKSLRELGIKADEVDVKTTRASMNGQVSSELNYDKWLRKQPKDFQDDVLGKEKARLFRKGLVMERFVDEDGREFTLKELQEREKDIWSQVYGKPQPTPDPQPRPRDPRDSFNLANMGELIKGRGKYAPDFTIEELDAKFKAQLTDQTANIVAKYPKPRQIVYGKDLGVMYHNGRLESGIQRETITHEYGHHIDKQIRDAEGGGIYFEWSAKGLKDEWQADRAAMGVYRKKRTEKDRRLRELRDELFDKRVTVRTLSTGRTITTERYEPKFDGATGLSDIIDSFVSGDFRKNYNVWGHQPSYWKSDRTNGTAESFANMFAIQNQPEARAWAEKNIPNMWAKFLAKLDEIE